MRKSNGKSTTMINRIKNEKAEIIKSTPIENLHVKIQNGNSKTGLLTYTVSLLPIIDCSNCSLCSGACYDIQNMRWSSCRVNRIINSIIHEHDPERYWNEISVRCKLDNVYLLRINVGGDMTDTDFDRLKKVALENPHTHFHFFTKNYDGYNKFLDKDEFPSNVHGLMSKWVGADMPNPHKVPEAHVRFKDGTCEVENPTYNCSGNCTNCFMSSTNGCWWLKTGETVVLDEH